MYALVPALRFFQILCPLSDDIDTKGVQKVVKEGNDTKRAQKVVKEGKSSVLLNYLTVTEVRPPCHPSKSQFPQP